VELKSTDITDLVVSSYGNYYWKAKINGLAREGSLDTKSISITKSKLFRDLQAAKAGYFWKHLGNIGLIKELLA